MSSSNPSITASDIITDVDGRLSQANLSSAVYLPWVSYSYQRVFQSLVSVGKAVAENFFGDTDTINLTTTSPNEYTLTDEIPRYGGLISVWVKYGATGDEYRKAVKLISTAEIINPENISTTYYSKVNPYYYVRGGVIGFLPVPPESGGVAKIDFIKRPYQINAVEDVIDIPYRYLWPVSEYVHSKAVQRLNEDYGASKQIEDNFRQQLEEISIACATEYQETQL